MQLLHCTFTQTNASWHDRIDLSNSVQIDTEKHSWNRGKERTRANRQNGWSNLILTKLAKKIGSRSEMVVQGIAAALRTNQKPCSDFVKGGKRREIFGTDTDLLKLPFAVLLSPVTIFCKKSQDRSTFIINKSRRAREI